MALVKLLNVLSSSLSRLCGNLITTKGRLQSEGEVDGVRTAAIRTCTKLNSHKRANGTIRELREDEDEVGAAVVDNVREEELTLAMDDNMTLKLRKIPSIRIQVSGQGGGAGKRASRRAMGCGGSSRGKLLGNGLQSEVRLSGATLSSTSVVQDTSKEILHVVVVDLIHGNGGIDALSRVRNVHTEVFRFRWVRARNITEFLFQFFSG